MAVTKAESVGERCTRPVSARTRGAQDANPIAREQPRLSLLPGGGRFEQTPDACPENHRGVKASKSMVARAMTAAWLLALPCVATACSPHVEAQPDGDSASLRQHTDAFTRCEMTESSYREVVGKWLRQRPTSAPPLRGLSLGRAFDYPWISHHLAEVALRHPQWAASRGKARSGGPNQWVASVLSEPAFLARLAVPFTDTPYAPVAVSVEKVLVGSAQDVAPELNAGKLLVPFDAQVWLHVETRR
ncbi:hypothetical protein [Accumulibacter sp.]|jgi:hypothetical protein|uniref:Uncharacterized protein n=1 Tax=Accumulibacter regalis TaxID=522306 RepID=C7RRU0_ACCRE|nr:hypothetical protein [Accumulibacter sp.]MBN8497811.1 hypothetical protein [Accumulibacter sp.]MBO3714556.1 hypothetical protein [Accumulibacter sp.]